MHHYGDMDPELYPGHIFELLGSRDVIGCVTVGLPTKPGDIGPMLVFDWNGWKAKSDIGRTLAQCRPLSSANTSMIGRESEIMRLANVHQTAIVCWI